MPTFSVLSNEPDGRSFNAGDTIFSEGQMGDSMYVVLAGEVEIRKGPRVLETVITGGVFGEMALIDQQPRSATAVASTDCTLAAIGQKRFAVLVQRTPYFALQLMQLLADRLRRNTAS